jgi:hypothetical protein
MTNNEIMGTFYDALTGETVVRLLTSEEITAYLEMRKSETPSPD